ncbi:uncharacterized protein LOC110954446 isoform X2 [Acanthochromis polyacanthus]|uniref:uncharacterized protein LOC110954446 isoform X2 n=1 Tax=Acanthochromis polyacanthus TaxID=80966 RepID=UPI000B8F4427|nr:uncharacterized protein LOC110954446 isoform X2 [Acanthochromis polyacanthus]
MGTGTSRGKRVAPACVSEVKVTKTGSGVTSSKQDSHPFKPLKIHTILRSARNRAQPDCHSEGHDSNFSGEEDDIDGELDTVLADYEERERDSGKKTPAKKTFIRSKTYGLCHFSREDAEEELSGRAEEPRVSHCASRDVNKRSNSAFTHVKKHTSGCPTQQKGFLTRGPLLEAVSTSEKQLTFGSCHSSSLTMPVILYDGSEEELMDTIEREFS